MAPHARTRSSERETKPRRAAFRAKLTVRAWELALQVVLASSSRYRRELLARLGIPFTTTAPNVDETRRPGESARALTLRLAAAKAAAVHVPDGASIVIASDQVAAVDQRILGKPGTEAKAIAMLESLSGRAVVFHTSLVVIDGATGRAQRHVDETRVRFRRVDGDEIRRYVACERPLDCAGAIKSEGRGVALLESMETQDPTALIGLPMMRLAALLRDAGVSFWRADGAAAQP